MQPTKRTRRRTPKSCTECRRRKQKCNPGIEGPCANCLRRYPPVECIGRPRPKADDEARNPQPKPANPSPSNPHHAHIPLIRVETPQYISPYPSKNTQNIDECASRSTPGLTNPESSIGSGASSVVTPEFEHDRKLQLYIESGQNSEYPFGSPKPFGGVIAGINTLYSAPIKPTLRNAELFQYFYHSVAPNLSSLDGKNVPPLFSQEMMPWMIQSPLMPNIGILMAAATQLSENENEAKRQHETLVIKSSVLGLINEFLRQDFSVVGGEALRAVIHLAIIEWFWGTNVSLWAHLKGIKQMVKLRGGFQGMNDPVLMQVFILTDYELACCFEEELSLPELSLHPHALQPPLSYPEKFSCPLLFFPTSFSENPVLNLSPEGAQILDHVRFLTTSITSPPSPGRLSKIHSTATLLLNRLHREAKNAAEIKFEPGPANFDVDGLILSVIRTTALVYVSCIVNLTPFTRAYTPSELSLLTSEIKRVGLTRWKEIQGIFLWIMLVATPSAGNDSQGKWLRRKMAVAGMGIGLEDFGLAIHCLSSFWRVQRWILRERELRGVNIGFRTV